jgi:hypothetical protein
MSRFRLLLAWLVMAAVPLQSWAAASMLLCTTSINQVTALTSVAQHEHASTVSLSAQHDHSGHHHAPGVADQKAVGDGSTSLPDASHQCGVCASCCHSAAITESAHHAGPAPVPQTAAGEPFVLIHARPAQVPDKPPRA